MKRIRLWDIAKGVAIILVILGHATELSDKGTDHFLHSFIYSFHMPLFMIISGYFFAYSLSWRNNRDIVNRKLIQLICPILLFSTIEFFAIRFNPSYSMKDNLYSFYAVLIRTLWFLQALFFSSMLVLIVERFTKHHIAFYALLLGVFVLTPDLLKSAGTKFLFPCFLYGLLIYRFHLDTQAKQKPLLIFIVSSLLFALLLIPFDHSKTIYVHSVYIFSGDSNPLLLLLEDVYRVVIGIIGSTAIISLILCMQKLLNGKHLAFGNMLAKIGTHTLGLYIVHIYLYIYLILPYIRSAISSFSNFMVVSIGFVLLLTVSYPLAILIEKPLNSAIKYISHYEKSVV